MEKKTPGNQVARFADVAMYEAASNPLADAGLPVEPQVHLVSMTMKPLQTMAAAAELYAGRIVTDPNEIDKITAMTWFHDMSRTVLEAPLEFIDLHFFIEGVPRDWSHQAVRQRTAVFVQESQRFAVKRNARFETATPPSIAMLKDDDPARVIWERQVAAASWSYNALIDAGIPAEDARKLLPNGITTRLHWKTNLRNLTPHAGMRLCSQAQFEWKKVWMGIIQAIRNFGPNEDRWQQEEIVKLFKPICYQTGRCQFRAATDRFCSIRDRVESNYAAGIPPEGWNNINPLEPLMEGAARLRPDRA